MERMFPMKKLLAILLPVMLVLALAVGIFVLGETASAPTEPPAQTHMTL